MRSHTLTGMFTRKRAGSTEAFPVAGGVREKLRAIIRQRAFMRYLAAKATSQGGDGLFQQAAAAVLLFEQASGNPSVDLLKITAIILVPFSLVGPLSGVFIDRFDRRKILVYTPFVRAGLAMLIPIGAATTDGPVFFAIVLIVLSINRFFLATLGAVLPQLVPPEDLLVANATSSTGGAVANVAGHAIGSIIAEVGGGRSTAAVAAVAFAGSGVIAKDLHFTKGLEEEPAPLGEELRRTWREMSEGFAVMRARPRVRFGMTAIGMMQVFVGAMVAILIQYLVGELGMGPASGFAMLAVLAVGVGAGVVLVPLIATRIGNDRTIPWAFAIGAIGPLLAALFLSRGMLAFAAGFVGLSYSLAKIPVDTLVQEDIGDTARGRAFAIYDMLFNLARVVGTATMAALFVLGASSVALTFITGIAFVATALWLSARLRVLEDRDESVPGAAASLAGSGLATEGPVFSAGDLVMVRSYAGGRADEEPREIVVAGVGLPLKVIWRAVADEAGVHWRVFVVECAGQRLRLRVAERGERWEVERILPI